MKLGDLLIQKYNPHHDAKGRFSSEGSATFTSTRIKRAGGGHTYHDVGAKLKAKHEKESLDALNREAKREDLTQKVKDARVGKLQVELRYQGVRQQMKGANEATISRLKDKIHELNKEYKAFMDKEKAALAELKAMGPAPAPKIETPKAAPTVTSKPTPAVKPAKPKAEPKPTPAPAERPKTIQTHRSQNDDDLAVFRMNPGVQETVYTIPKRPD